MEKGVLHAATGSGHWKVIGWDDFVFESNVRFSFSAIMKANGSCSGEIQLRDEGPLYEAHGKANNIKVSDNIAKVSINFTHGNFGQYYNPPVDITTMSGWFIAIDNGEGNNSNGVDMLSMILWTDGSDIGEQTIEEIEAMSPEEFLLMMQNYLLPLYGIPYEAYLSRNRIMEAFNVR